MTHKIVTVVCDGPGLKLPNNESYIGWDNTHNEYTPCESYQHLLENEGDVDVLVYAHDDLTIHDEDWFFRIGGRFLHDLQVGQRYSESKCVAVGLGGAIGLGTADLYRKPYSIWNLARQGYASNQDDAEVHGKRFTGVRRCAVIEQFLMAIRTDWLRSIGGWPTKHLSHHGLDMWLACEAARADKEIWQVGVACHHAGGATSTKEIYTKAHWLQGGSAASDHEIPHRWIYDSYKDCLPIRV